MSKRICLLVAALLAGLRPGARAEVLPATSPYGEAAVTRNIAYVANAAPRQNFDLIRPQHPAAQPCSLVVWIHGGAWMSGSKDWDNVKFLVRHGYAIASVDYRFSPEARFPAQIQDCNAALDFILAHATNYGVSPQHFVVAGGSAGGQLALLLGLARQEKTFGANPAIRPAAILDFFGPADFSKMKDDLTEIHSQAGLNLMQDAGTKLLGPVAEQTADQLENASPITYVSAASPPVLILQGGQDDLVPAAQSRRLHEALDAAGVKNQLVVVAAAGHDGPLFATPEMAAKVVHFLDEVLKSSKGEQ
jgi:acetyl esterase/lipase